MQDLRIEVDERTVAGAGVAIVTVEGEIDLGNAEELEAALASQPCEASDRLVLDLSNVPFMDSSGLRVLLLAAGERDEAVSVVLADDSPVRRLLELAEVAERLAIHTSREAALDQIGDRAPDRG